MGSRNSPPYALIVASIFFLFGAFIIIVKHQSSVVVNFSSSSSALTHHCNTDHGELLIGHKILRHTLGLEGDLKHLKTLRKWTFRGPTGELERLLTLVHETSSQRGKELDELWKLDPPILTEEAPVSAIGDAIQNAAETKGTFEMITPGLGEWQTRFYFLQAQATRMVAAVALSAAKMDKNAERQRWLKKLAKEYEDLREQLVRAAGSNNSSCSEVSAKKTIN